MLSEERGDPSNNLVYVELEDLGDGVDEDPFPQVQLDDVSFQLFAMDFDRCDRATLSPVKEGQGICVNDKRGLQDNTLLS